MNFTYPHYHTFIRSSEANESRVLVLFHGTGGNEHDLIPLAERIAPGLNYLGIRGNVNEGGMPRFFRRLAEGIFDEADIIDRAGQLDNFMSEAAVYFGFDRKEASAVGYSNGANIISALNFLHPGSFQNSILLRPMTPLIPEPEPDLSGCRVMLSFGSHDPLMPVGEADKLTGLYKKYGAETAVHVEQSGHQLVQQDLVNAGRFLVGSGTKPV